MTYGMISVFIISAPSGSGKSTLVHRLLKTVPNLAFSISYTTRPPRPSETDGVDYIFITRKDFEDRLARGEFLEYAEVFGNYYGTNRESFEAATQQGKDLVLDIDVQGARQLKVAIPEAISIFVLAAIPGGSGAAAALAVAGQRRSDPAPVAGRGRRSSELYAVRFCSDQSGDRGSLGAAGVHRRSRAAAQGPDGRGSPADPREF